MTLQRFFKRFTKDRDTRDPPALQQIMTVEQIGPRRSLTPEGFLLCEGVPIARIGVMLYGPGETPVEVGGDGVAYITRDAGELFKPECLASFVGKPVVDEHPEMDVTPDNWAKLARGVAFNIRQGSDEDADVILADLLITDARMIRDIEAMKREVSAGYEADYEQTGDGQGVQTNIIGNHIALVERGRCGPRCAIGDHHHSTARKPIMATQTRHASGKPARRKISQSTLDALMEQLQAGEGDPDASTMDDGTLADPADSHTHIHIHGLGSTASPTQGAGAVNSTGAGGSQDDAGGEGGGNASVTDPKTEARFASLENGHKEILTQIAALADAVKAVSGKGGSGGEDPSGTDDENKEEEDKTKDEGNPFATKKDDEEGGEGKDPKSKTKDSAALETSYKETLSGCEVLVPGFRMPTFDAKAKRAVTIDSMCSARRKALDAFAVTTEGQQIVETLSGVKTVDTTRLACQDVAVLFRAAVGAKKLLNNGNATRDANRLGQAGNNDSNKGRAPAPKSLADLNKAYREHYAKAH